jgi:hypothetical protein
MAHASHTARTPQPHTVGWRRVRRPRWARPNERMALAGQPIVAFATTRAALAQLTIRVLSDIDHDDPHAMEETYD